MSGSGEQGQSVSPNQDIPSFTADNTQDPAYDWRNYNFTQDELYNINWLIENSEATQNSEQVTSVDVSGPSGYGQTANNSRAFQPPMTLQPSPMMQQSDVHQRAGSHQSAGLPQSVNNLRVPAHAYYAHQQGVASPSSAGTSDRPSPNYENHRDERRYTPEGHDRVGPSELLSDDDREESRGYFPQNPAEHVEPFGAPGWMPPTQQRSQHRGRPADTNSPVMSGNLMNNHETFPQTEYRLPALMRQQPQADQYAQWEAMNQAPVNGASHAPGVSQGYMNVPTTRDRTLYGESRSSGNYMNPPREQQYGNHYNDARSQPRQHAQQSNARSRPASSRPTSSRPASSRPASRRQAPTFPPTTDLDRDNESFDSGNAFFQSQINHQKEVYVAARSLPDFPTEKSEERKMVDEIIEAIKDTSDTTADGPRAQAVAAIAGGQTYSDGLIERGAWQLLFYTGAAQAGLGIIKMHCPATVRAKSFDSFSDRYRELLAALRQSKASCKGVLQEQNMIIMAINPGGMLKGKLANKALNSKRNVEVKVGREDIDAQKHTLVEDGDEEVWLNVDGYEIPGTRRKTQALNVRAAEIIRQGGGASPSQSNAASTPAASSKKRTRSQRVQDEDEDEGSSGDGAYNPAPSKRRRGAAKPRAAPRSRAKRQEADDEDDF